MSRKRSRIKSSRKSHDRPAENAAAIRELTPIQSLRRFDEMAEREAGLGTTTTVFEAYRRNAWVYGAISQIASMVSQTPFVVQDKDGNTIEGDTELSKAIERPNTYDQQNTSTKYRYAYMSNLLMGGAVMRILTGLEGFKPAGWFTRPRWKFRAEETYDENGLLSARRWDYVSGVGKTIHYTPGDDIYHDALFNPYHDYEGLSPLQAAIIGINNSIDVGEFAHRFFQNDGSTGLIFTSEHPGFLQPQADAAKESWERKHAGLSNAYKAKFLGFGLKPQTFGTPFDARSQQVLAQLSKEEIITGIYKIPLEVFGSQTRATSGVQIGGGNKTEDALETFLVNVIMPWATRYDEDFNRDVAWRFPEGHVGRHVFEDNPILERKRLQRAQGLAELIDRGVPLNEAIRWLQLSIAPQPHGDEFWLNNNMVPARVILEAGDSAMRLATGEAQEAAVRGYIDQIVTAAQKTETMEAARAAFRARSNGNGGGNGHTNATRIGELLTCPSGS